MIVNSFSSITQSLKLTPTHPFDIHLLFQNLRDSYRVTMSTTRKIEINNQKTRVAVKLTIQICSVSSDLENNLLTVRGRVAKENEKVKLGSFHNMTIGLNDTFYLEVDGGLKQILKRLLSDIVVFLVVIQRNGKFEVAAIDEYGIDCKGSFKKKELVKFLKEKCINEEKSNLKGKKTGGSKQHGETKPKITEKFPITNKYTVKYIIANFSISLFMNSEFPTHIIKTSKEDENLRFKVLINQILSNQKNASIPFIKNLHLANKFLDMYQQGDDLVALGLKDVLLAMEYSAIHSVIITISLYCSFDVAERRKIRKMIDALRKIKKVVIIISDGHICGEKLNEIGGIGAILKYNFRENI